MNDSSELRLIARVLWWMARIGGIAALVPLMMIVVGEPATGPAGAREWLYLALFPFGFALGYLLGWRWPLFGGSLSLLCLATSLMVIGRRFGADAYSIWAVVALPGILFAATGLLLRPRKAWSPVRARAAAPG